MCSNPFIHSFFLSFNKYLLSASSVPETILSPGEQAVNKTDKKYCPHNTYAGVLVEGRGMKVRESRSKTGSALAKWISVSSIVKPWSWRKFSI